MDNILSVAPLEAIEEIKRKLSGIPYTLATEATIRQPIVECFILLEGMKTTLSSYEQKTKNKE